MDLGLRGKTVLVTGASGGIGRAVACAFGAEGCNVAVHYRSNESAAEEVAARTRSAGGTACLLRADLTEGAQADGLVRQVVERFAALDVLVNCAGVSLRQRLHEITDQEWNWVVATNLSATFYLCRAASRAMMERHRGVIINIASASGIVGSIGTSAYAATKAGVIMLTKVLAGELAPYGIRALSCSPGLMSSVMASAPREGSAEGTAQSWETLAYQGNARARLVPLARAASGDEVAAMIVCMASDRASYLTGVDVPVHGGKFAVQNPWIAWEGL